MSAREIADRALREFDGSNLSAGALRTWLTAACERAAEEEREACAKVCESHQSEHRVIFECEDGFLNSATREIRARGQG